MSQTPHPHDPFAAQPGATQPDAPRPPEAPQPAAPQASGPEHPHDPYAYEPAPAQAEPAPQSPYAQQTPHAPQGAAPQPVQPHPLPGGQMSLDQPPADLKGAYAGPLSGQPATESDSKMWAMFAQLSTIVGYVIGMGMLGWVGPLIIFLLYKDRDRFVRYNAAEALNAAIATFIAEVALIVVISIIAVITFGIGSVLYFLVGIPALLHIIFAIIGAVKANQGEYWNYPINIRLVK